ncbi:MFS transporter [Streptomyces sp. NBC_01537]|uniref:MFS transporter n=1 Tax=Streptomyces sp. NBC_01537 TaxID=2903896 RepID=UPI00386809B6
MTVTTGEAAPRLGVLRIPAFRWFFAGQFASSFGDCLVGPALAFAVLDLTGSAGDLGLVLAARTVPVVAFMLLGGVLADRLPKHRVMLGADLVRVAGQGGCAGLLITGHAHIWQLMALQAVNGAASAMFTPAVSGLIQQTVPTDHRQAANALHTASRSVSMVAGPLVSALLVISVGSGWALAADAATFAVSAACLARLRLPAGTGTPVGSRIVADLRDGWREFRSRTWVWSLILMSSLTNMCAAVLSVLGPLVSARDFGGAGAWGAIMATLGAGAVTGGLLTVWIRPRRPLRLAVLVATLCTTPMLVMSQASSPVPVAIAAFFSGVGLMIFNPLWETVLQREIPASSLSKVSAYEWLGSYAATPVGQALAGPVALQLGVRRTLLYVGLGYVAISLAPLAVRDVRGYGS